MVLNPAKNAATVPGRPRAWARVTLVAGTSRSDRWQVDSSISRAQVVVGSRRGSSWRIRAAGVAPQNLALLWDGARLWIADLVGGGRITLDGKSLRDWQPVADQVRIDVGRAVLVAETSVRPVPLPFDARPPTPLDDKDPGLAATIIAPPDSQPRCATPPPTVMSPLAPAAGLPRAVPAAATPARRPQQRSGPRAARRPPAGARRSLTHLPLRTWGLVAVTCGALLGVMFINEGRVESTRRPARGRTPVAAASVAAPAVAPTSPPARITATPAEAADLLMAGRSREALVLYDQLARRHPDRPVNAAIVKILKRRVAASADHP